MTYAWKTALPLSRKMVLLALCDNANDQGECYPSLSMIAKKCSMTERGVHKCITDLEKNGFIVRENRSGRSTLYTITNPGTWFTPEQRSPLNDVHPTPEPCSPPPLNNVPITPEQRSPITIINHQLNRHITIKGGGDATAKKVDGRAKPQKPDKQEIELPAWLNPDDWESLVEHRKSIKSPMSLQAQRLSIAKLDELRRKGHDPTEVINQTIMHGWKGLFPLRLEQQNNTRKTANDERAATIEALTGRGKNRQSGRIIDITPNTADAVD